MVCVCPSEIGMGLTGFGVFFLFFGMILFFDKALLAIGNVSNLLLFQMMLGCLKVQLLITQMHYCVTRDNYY